MRHGWALPRWIASGAGGRRAFPRVQHVVWACYLQIWPSQYRSHFSTQPPLTKAQETSPPTGDTSQFGKSHYCGHKCRNG
jgi:hypothetical protein